MSIFHGLSFAESLEGTRYLKERSQSVIGLVAVSTDADATAFPLNAPVLVTNLRAAIAKAGAIGTLAPSLKAIRDQADAVVIVVRTAIATGQDAEATTTANLVAAVEQFRSCQALLGVKPKILGVPGHDNQEVTAKLAEVAGKLRAFAYASAGGEGADTVAEAVTYRAEFSERELMLLYPDAKRGADGVHAVALALGLRAAIDLQQGWHKTLSNVPIKAITGVERPLSWDFESMATDAGALNDADITALIHNNGYRFWGNRTCSDDPLFAFESTVRTNNALKDMIADGLQWASDKPLHPSLARDILETINLKGRELVRSGRLIGFKAWMEAADNPAETLAAGKLKIRYSFTAVPPLEELGVTVTVTDEFFSDFAARV